MHAYDRNSNRLTRTNQGSSAYSETYAYDGLDRLIDANRNNNNLQDWSLDALGNWAGTTIGASSQTRTHNAANETTDISGVSWIDPVYDAAGNMTSGPKAGDETTRLYFTYDAWNRLIAVYNASYVLVATYEYDAAGRRIEKVIYQSNGYTVDYTLDYFWNEGYQNIETRKNDDTDPIEQTVYDIRYIDAPVVRWYDSNLDGDYVDAADNTLSFAQDANFNVTAVVNASDGAVAERYVYTPYGTRAAEGCQSRRRVSG